MFYEYKILYRLLASAENVNILYPEDEYNTVVYSFQSVV